MNRKNEIIKLIAKYDSITGKEIAKIMNCSLKTVQNEVKEINNEYNIIESSPNGYTLNSNYFNSNVSFEDANDENMILSALLLRENKLDIDEIADEFYLSRTTIDRRLLKIKHLISKYDLTLEKQRNRIWIEGKEKNKRALISSLISKEADSDFNRTSDSGFNFLQGIDTNVIKNIVLNVVDKYNYAIRACCFYGLLANITICLYRCKNGSHVEDNTNTSNNDNEVEYSIASDIYKEYSSIWKIKYTTNDLHYLASLLQGQIALKENNINYRNDNSIINDEFENSIKNIITSTFSYYGLNIDIEENSNFIYNFSLHVKSLIERARNNNTVENDMLLSIKRNCPFIYDVAVYIYNKIKDIYSVNISEEEIGYIAVHIGFLIERANKNTINILLLTSSYSGVKDNIKQKLMYVYGDTINIIEDPNEFTKQSVDLIITNKETNIFGTKTVAVSPFFDANDQENVMKAINSCTKIKDELFKNVIYATFLTENLFFLKNDIKNKDEAIKFMSQEMLKLGIVDDDFEDCVKQREELSSTCFFGSFAIPHGLQFNAHKSRCCILISENGIEWDNSNIHIVILIAVRYHDRHIFMKMYDSMIQSLQNEKKFIDIINSKSLDQFIGIVKE